MPIKYFISICKKKSNDIRYMGVSGGSTGKKELICKEKKYRKKCINE